MLVACLLLLRQCDASLPQRQDQIFERLYDTFWLLTPKLCSDSKTANLRALSSGSFILIVVNFNKSISARLD